jgi:dihydroorotate dehydrogenase (fumarate)
MEDAGVAAIVMHSVFEEQITREQLGTIYHMEVNNNSYAEALSYFPDPPEFHLGPDEYLDQIRKVKEATNVPIIGSLNGLTAGGWIEYAKKIEEAGADALELNMFYLPTDVAEDAGTVEKMQIDAVQHIKKATKLPVCVKLAAMFSALPNFVKGLADAGADGVVLFNRFYQPDIDIHELEATPTLSLSTSQELLLRLRWIAVMAGKVDCSLGLTGGVHTHTDVIKSVMVGADAVQLTSCLLKNGPKYLGTLLEVVREWMETNEYESLAQMKGSMSLVKSPDPTAFTRANYMRVLQSWKV